MGMQLLAKCCNLNCFLRSENGELVCIATEESYFVLKYDADAVARARETKEDITEDGIETAFDVRVF